MQRPTTLQKNFSEQNAVDIFNICYPHVKVDNISIEKMYTWVLIKGLKKAKFVNNKLKYPEKYAEGNVTSLEEEYYIRICNYQSPYRGSKPGKFDRSKFYWEVSSARMNFPFSKETIQKVVRYLTSKKFELPTVEEFSMWYYSYD